MSQKRMEHFESVLDLKEYIENEKVHSSWGYQGLMRHSLKSGEDRLEFTGTENMQDALKLAVDGWPEGLDRITEKIGIINSLGRSKIRNHDVAGDFPDVGRFVSGIPVCMTRRIVSLGLRRPIIDLQICMSASAGVDSGVIMNYGAAILRLVDELEGRGFSVGIQVCALGKEDDLTFGMTLDLKKPGEVIELSKIAFCIGHPSFLRRLAFAVWETKGSKDELGDGYGRPEDLYGDDKLEGALYFPMHIGWRLNEDCGTPEKAIHYVTCLVRQQRPDLIPELELSEQKS